MNQTLQMCIGSGGHEIQIPTNHFKTHYIHAFFLFNIQIATGPLVLVLKEDSSEYFGHVFNFSLRHIEMC